jgi:hypothetical protein
MDGMGGGGVGGWVGGWVGGGGGGMEIRGSKMLAKKSGHCAFAARCSGIT